MPLIARIDVSHRRLPPGPALCRELDEATLTATKIG